MPATSCHFVLAQPRSPWPCHADGTRYDHFDVQFSVVAVIDEFGALAERVAYDAYGRARHRWFSDLDGDGDSDVDDFNIQSGAGSTTIHGTNYRPEADHDRDGDVDSVDYFYFLTAASRAALAEGLISDPLGPDSPIGYDGYVFAPEAGLNAPAGGPQAQAIGAYCVRFRWYLPETGRWLERDPAGYVGGWNLMESCLSAPVNWTDPMGSEPEGDLLDDEARRRAICAALREAREQGMDLREFAARFDPTWGTTSLLYRLEWDTERYGNVDVDWLLLLLHVHYDGVEGGRYWLDPLWGAEPELIYDIGKPYWIVKDGLDVGIDPSRFGLPNELAAIRAARDLLAGEITLEEFFEVDCSEEEDSACHDTSDPGSRRSNDRDLIQDIIDEILWWSIQWG